MHSGRRRCCTGGQASERPDAGRISTSQQDSVPAESARERHQRPAHGSLLSVCIYCLYGSIVKADPMLLRLRYPNLYEVRLIPTKKDIAFVEYMDEGSATVAKDALHNYKLDGENKIKVSYSSTLSRSTSHVTLLHRLPSPGSDPPLSPVPLSSRCTVY